MRLAQVLGLALTLCSVSLLLAQGIGIPKKEDVPKYLEMLKTSKVAADRAKAADMLGKRGSINVNDVEEAIEPLQLALQKDKDGKVRAAAAHALGNIRPDPETTVPILIDKLKNDEVMDVKMATVVALGQYGGDAKDALTPLRELQKKVENKKSNEFKTIQASIQSITGAKKKKN